MRHRLSLKAGERERGGARVSLSQRVGGCFILERVVFISVLFYFLFFLFLKTDMDVITTRGGCKKGVMTVICYLSLFALSVRYVQDRDRYVNIFSLVMRLYNKRKRKRD